MKLFENSPARIPVGTLRLELKGVDSFCIVAASRACCEMLSCDASQLNELSTQFTSLIHPDDRSSFELALEHVFQGADRFAWQGCLRIEATEKLIRLDLDPIETDRRHVILGRRKIKGNMEIELAIDAMELAPRLDHAVLFSGDGDFSPLVDALQRQGVRVSVVSTIRGRTPMASDALRRQADNFIELAELRDVIGRPARSENGAKE